MSGVVCHLSTSCSSGGYLRSTQPQLISSWTTRDTLCISFGLLFPHRPHSRQVTGARSSGGRSSPVMSWILLKANNAQQASGVGDKRFFCCKRNVQHFWTAIIRHHVNDITHQHVMRFNQWSKFANIFKSIWKVPSASGHSGSPFTSSRTRPSWHNGSSLGPQVLNGYGSMTQNQRIRIRNLYCFP